MKSLLFGILMLINAFQVYSQTFQVRPIKVAGPDSERINLVILSEGYKSSELQDFIADATIFSNSMFSQSPFNEYADYFNVYAIEVPSNESGADHPATATDVDESGSTPYFVDTYFNATFDAFGYHRYLYYGIDYNAAASAEVKIRSVLADNFPTYDQALILVNSPTYGGTGGKFPIASTHVSSSEIAIHELGHSMFDLKDEYLVPDVYYAEAINMTQETNASLVKWKNWLGINGVGLNAYGSSGVPATWYKPRKGECKMEVLNKPFCAVCNEGMVENIHDLVSPLLSFSPSKSTVDKPSDFPLQFELDLLKPIPNTLESIWTLNSTNIANNMDAVSIEEGDLIQGENTLTAAVHDNTPFLKIDNHETIHVYTVTWTINYSTLGVEDIKSSVNDLSIDMYPNPTNGLVNFKFEHTNSINLNIALVGMDGKRLKQTSSSNQSYQQMDISDLKIGVYLINFYADNVLLTTKKLVKN